ncbi:hypothetical protein SB764_37655, partial [Paraburkholderia sp. SIMBA_027]
MNALAAHKIGFAIGSRICRDSDHLGKPERQMRAPFSILRVWRRLRQTLHQRAGSLNKWQALVIARRDFPYSVVAEYQRDRMTASGGGFNRSTQHLESARAAEELQMKQRPRIYYSETQKALMWDRWRKGDTIHQIAKLFDRGHSSIQRILS